MEVVSLKDESGGLVVKWFETEHSIVLPYVLIFGAALLRLAASHPFNFIPVFSCLLFYAANRSRQELAIPFLTLIGVDIFLTTHRYGYSLTGGHAVTWIWYLAALLFGAGMLRNSLSTSRVIGASLLASVSFFLASNFTVWVEWGMYPKTFAGLEVCYIAALPFFRNSVISELVFSLLLFGLSGYTAALMPAKRMQGACS